MAKTAYYSLRHDSDGDPNIRERDAIVSPQVLLLIAGVVTTALLFLTPVLASQCFNVQPETLTILTNSTLYPATLISLSLMADLFVFIASRTGERWIDNMKKACRGTEEEHSYESEGSSSEDPRFTREQRTYLRENDLPAPSSYIAPEARSTYYPVDLFPESLFI